MQRVRWTQHGQRWGWWIDCDSVCGCSAAGGGRRCGFSSSPSSAMPLSMMMPGALVAATATGLFDACSQTSTGKTVVVTAVDLDGVDGGWNAIRAT